MMREAIKSSNDLMALIFVLIIVSRKQPDECGLSFGIIYFNFFLGIRQKNIKQLNMGYNKFNQNDYISIVNPVKMLNLIIIDDEPESLQYLTSLIELYTPEMKISGVYTDPYEGLDAILKMPPDVLFLDIEMPGLTGFELLKLIPKINFDIIFITAYNQYAIEAIKHHALDYLLKPVGPTEFKEAIQQAINRRENRSTLDRLDELKKFLEKSSSSAQKQDSRISISTKKSIEIIQVKSVIRIEADGNYSTFYLKNNHSEIVSKNIKTYEGLDEYDLMRIHRSHIVNLHHVERYVYTDGGYIEMIDKSKVPVSHTIKEELIDRLKKLK